MDYLIKASAVLLIFYACYQLFLQRETFFQANRIFLLIGLFIATCLPLVVIPIYIEYTPIDLSAFVVDSPSSVEALPTIQEEPFDYTIILYWIYAAGILFFLGKLIIEFISLYRVLHTSKAQSQGEFKIMETSEDIAPFSFFNRIVYNPNQFNTTELEHVITHEKVHSKQWHSFDTLVVNMACLLFWFNPIIWLYKKALQQNLEFIADQKAQYISECKKSYQTVLLKASVKNHQLAFTNQFYTSLIKKRIVMLHKSKSHKLNSVKFLFIIPLLALFMMSFNTKEVYIETPTETTTIPSIVENDGKDIEIVFHKNMSDDDLKTIQKDLAAEGVTFEYSDLKRNKDGEITGISTTFSGDGHSATYNTDSPEPIEKFYFRKNDKTFGVGQLNPNTFTFKSNDGATTIQSTTGNVYVVEEIDEEKEENNGKVKIIKRSNIDSVYFKSKDGKTYSWTSDDGKSVEIDASNKDKNAFYYRTNSDEPIYIIDGKVVTKEELEDVDSDDIKSLHILKGKSAVEVYGNSAKNGAVILQKKDAKGWTIDHDKKSNFKVEYEFFDTDDDDAPLIIMDDKVITKKEMKTMNYNLIDKIEVIKDKRAIEIYGDKGKNGVVIIDSKAGNINADKIRIRTSDKGDYKVKVKGATYTDDDGNVTKVVTGYNNVFVVDNSSAMRLVDKGTPKEILERDKQSLKDDFGLDVRFSKIKRNKDGMITRIKIMVKDSNGNRASATYESSNGIPPIKYGNDYKGQVVVSSQL